MNRIYRKQNKQDGITLLVTLLTMGVLLSVAASLMNITLKQYQLSGIVYSSEIAFQAATAGSECALFYDHTQNKFDASDNDTERYIDTTLSCFGAIPNAAALIDGGDNIIDSGEEQLYRYSWGTPEVCTEFSVYKFYEKRTDDANTTGPQVTVDGVMMKGTTTASNECPEGSECTVVQSRGYNVPCNVRNSGSRVVEREYTQVY